MSDRAGLRTGGQQVADALCRQGVDTVFCVPGESFLDVLNALHGLQDRIRLVSCRHEGGAAFMAEAQGKLTRRPGVCMVTRGPGASNAAIGVHTAFQDATPMVLLIGQVGREHMERGAFQEVDYRRMFGPLCKWVAQIDDVARIDEFIDRAFAVALAGQPGPVVLALPEDMLTDSSFPIAASARGKPAPPRPHPAPEEMRRLQALLATAARPLLWLGGSLWSDVGLQDIARFAADQALPVACSFRRQDLFDNDSAHYVGETGLGMRDSLAQAIERADLLLVVGARLSEVATRGY
ncbi:MAG: thiamine pyrophosphate-binding protein, partial [Rubrivivax sp.]